MRFIPLKPGSKRPVQNDWQNNWTHERPEGNAGILLKGEYIVIDIDIWNDEAHALEAEILSRAHTWTQKTKKGRHFLFSVDATSPTKSGIMYDAGGERIGELLVNNYIVAPGSVVDGHTYMLDDRPVLPFSLVQDYVQNLVDNKPTLPEIARDGGLTPHGGVPRGQHDTWLTRLGGWLRGQGGLSEERIFEVLHKGALAALEGIDPMLPYTQDDLRRIAHSSASWAAERANVNAPRGAVSAADYKDDHTRTVWLLNGLIPRGELVLQYGRGGIGKTTWVKWLAGECLRKQLNFGVIASEEPFTRFIHSALATHNPTDEQLARFFEIQGTWTLPDQVEELTALVKLHNLDVLYLDSIYSNFASKDSSNAAEKARHALSSLVVLCRTTGCTIIGTFHENKLGQSLGSLEMENVPRVLIHAEQQPNGNTTLTVQKTNFRKPTSSREILGEWVTEVNKSGIPIEEVMEDGTIQQCMIFAVRELAFVDIEDTSMEIIPMDTAPEGGQGHAERQAQRGRDCLEGHTDYALALELYRSTFPSARKIDAEKHFGWSKTTVRKYWA